jgi:hypothetical protein
MDTNEFAFSEREGEDSWVIHIKEGKWKDTYYKYGKVTLQPPEGYEWVDLEDQVDITPILKYDYCLIESPLELSELKEDPEFNDYLGDILAQVINDAFEKGDYKIGDQNASESRNDNPEESNS